MDRMFRHPLAASTLLSAALLLGCSAQSPSSSGEHASSSTAQSIADPAVVARALFAEKASDVGTLRTVVEACLAMEERQCPQAQDLTPDKDGALTQPFPFDEALSQSQEESAMVYTFSDRAPPLLRGAEIVWTRNNNDGTWRCSSNITDPKLSFSMCED